MRGLGLFLGLNRRAHAVVAPPVNTVAPVASGTAYVGQTLSCTTGTWTGAPTFTYQWQRSGVNIGGATSSTYTVVLADEGASVRCVVTATNAGGSASANSNALELWIPTDGGTVVGRWDAYDLATITYGTAPSVLSWASKGTSADGTVQNGTPSSQPVYNATGLNGRPTLEMSTAAAQRFRNTTVSAAWAKNKAAATSGVAARLTTVGGTRSLFVIGSAANNIRFGGPRTTATTYTMATRRLDTDASANFISTATPIVDVPFFGISEVDWSTAQQRYSHNGTAQAFAATGWASGAGNSDNTDSNNRNIGCSATNSEGWDGSVSEVVYYETLLSASDREKLEGYLAWRWGMQANLPIAHPWKNTPPTP